MRLPDFHDFHDDPVGSLKTVFLVSVWLGAILHIALWWAGAEVCHHPAVCAVP